jgi:hypothetical protein
MEIVRIPAYASAHPDNAMKKPSPPSLLLLVFLMSACIPLAATATVPVDTFTPAANPSSSPSRAPVRTPTPEIYPTLPTHPTFEASSSGTLKKTYLADTYVIEIPKEYDVREILSSPITSVPIYILHTPDGGEIIISLNPYKIASSPIPGLCVSSAEFDAGASSASFYCEGLELSDWFTVPAGWTVKYGSLIYDRSLACTMNLPCPLEVTPEARYSIEYVFVIPEKSHGYIIEFFIGDAFRSPFKEIEGFKGLGAVVHDLILPSLSLVNP